MREYGLSIKIDGTRSIVKDKAGQNRLSKSDLNQVLAKQYENEVFDLLNSDIHDSQTGSHILAQIWGNTVWILPQSADFLDAETDYAGNARDAYAKGQQVGIATYDLDSDKLEKQVIDKSLGTGKGTGALILFSARWWSFDQGPGSLADEMLCHELVHALRIIDGKYRAASTVNSPVDRCYDNVEEFYAILVANIYMGEAGGGRLRANHKGFSDLVLTGRTDDLSDPAVFYQTYKDEIMSFCQEMSNLCFYLKDIPVDFNPIREHFKNNPTKSAWDNVPDSDPKMWSAGLGD